MEPREASDLPRKQMLANSFAALNPPDKLWRRYLAEIQRLHSAGDITDEDVGLLVFSSEARSELVDLTLGEVDAFAEGTVPEVLEAARTSARASVESELADKSREADGEREQREKAELRAKKEETERKRAEELSAGAHAAHDRRRQEVARKIASIAAWCIFGVLAAVLMLGSVALAFGGIFGNAPLIVRGPIAVAVTFTLVFSFANAIFGWSAQRIAKALRDRLYPRVARLLDRILSVEDERKS